MSAHANATPVSLVQAIGQATNMVQAPARQTYITPSLLVLGDVRDLTLGGTAGTGDSGNAGTQQF